MSLEQGRKGDRGEQSQRTAADMAKSIGSELVSPGREWQELRRVNLPAFLESIGLELGLTWSEWKKLLMQSGSWLFSVLDNQVSNLQAKVTEQATAISLRETFGVPESDLALPVFAQLAGMEARAREALKAEATAAAITLERIQREVSAAVALFFASELNKLEDEEQAFIQALQATKEETSQRVVLAQVQQMGELRLTSSLREVSARKNALLEMFERYLTQIGQKIKRVGEVTIYQASSQQLAITAIN
jgi:hypothetical protein